MGRFVALYHTPAMDDAPTLFLKDRVTSMREYESGCLQLTVDSAPSAQLFYYAPGTLENMALVLASREC